MFFPRRCLSKKRPQRIGFYSRHKRCTSALCKYRRCLICLDLLCNEWDSLMTKDCAILENFQLLIPRGKQLVHLSSAREILMPSYKAAWREVVLISPVAAGTRACEERFGNWNRSPQGLCCPMSREAVGHVRQEGAHCQRGGREVAREQIALSRLIFQAKPFLLSFLFFSCCR